MSVPADLLARLRALVFRRREERELAEELRGARGTSFLLDVVGDVAFALRTLGRRPGFTVAAIDPRSALQQQ